MEAIEATHKPIIDPPKKEIDNADSAPEFSAAVAVLTFACVAEYIPMNPAIAEDKAPTAIAIAVYHPSGEKPHAITSTKTTGARILYSVNINTFAPQSLLWRDHTIVKGVALGGRHLIIYV